jgi:sporulation protein YlmC with PRC-barrel domain
MRSKLFVGGLLASILIVPALAQSTTPPAPAATSPAASDVVAQRPAGELWRSSKLIGLDIYNDQNEKLGDVTEVLLDKSGKVAGVVIGIGGFLGIGQHDIMVDMSKLKFVNEPIKAASSTTTTTTTGTGVTRPGTTTATVRTEANKWYPDHAILSGVTKDQLKAMPQFKFD